MKFITSMSSFTSLVVSEYFQKLFKRVTLLKLDVVPLSDRRNVCKDN